MNAQFLAQLFPKICSRSQSNYLFASTNGDFFECANVVNEKIHETKFVAEADQNVQTRGMQSNAVCFFSKLFP